ncbi:MAG: recombinase family protein [Anaerolineae bacterium]|nr:recombinase family protein [Anaerolineae bacterium]
MQTIGYIRVSTEDQDLSKQKHLLLEYSQQQHILIDEFIAVEMSSRKTPTERRIDELFTKLQTGDRVIVAELSRLGRNMLETLNIINELGQKGIAITFIRQPELSTTGGHSKLLLAIYSYFAETEREFISIRTKQGLAAARASGTQLGRPKGSRNRKQRVLDPFKPVIVHYIAQHIPIASIMKVINPQLDKPLSYNSYKYYIHRLS